MGLKPIATRPTRVFKSRPVVFILKTGSCARLSPLFVREVKMVMCSAHADLIVDVSVDQNGGFQKALVMPPRRNMGVCSPLADIGSQIPASLDWWQLPSARLLLASQDLLKLLVQNIIDVLGFYCSEETP